MEKDIVPGLLELIEKEFDEKTRNSEVLKKAVEELINKKATYKDAHEFAIEVGEILSEVLKTHITVETLPDGRMYFNIADRIMNSTMRKNYDIITGYAIDVQTELNRSAGLKLKGQKPKLNQSRIDGIVERLSTAEEFEEIKWILNEPIINFSQAIVDDTAKENVAFHAKAGLKPKITRVVVGDCCDWCRALAGTYTYGDEPEDIYRRHRYCRCRVEYSPGDGKRQDVWTKEWIDPEKDAKIEARKKIGIRNKGYNNFDKATSKALRYGKETGNECLLWLNEKGVEVVQVATGNSNSVAISQEAQKYLLNANKDSVISLHNHPRSSAFSPEDINIACKYESIKEMRVIGHDNTEYYLQIGNGKRPEWAEISNTYSEIKSDLQRKYQRMFDETQDGDATWKEHSNEINERIARKFNWKYRRVVNEKGIDTR